MYQAGSEQQWEPVKFHKRTGADAPKHTVAKQAAPKSGLAATIDSQLARKLENDTENLAHERVSPALRQQITQARIAAKLTQAQLAQRINELPKIVQEYENGKAIPDNKILQKLSKALGVVLKKNSVKTETK